MRTVLLNGCRCLIGNLHNLGHYGVNLSKRKGIRDADFGPESAPLFDVDFQAIFHSCKVEFKPRRVGRKREVSSRLMVGVHWRSRPESNRDTRIRNRLLYPLSNGSIARTCVSGGYQKCQNRKDSNRLAPLGIVALRQDCERAQEESGVRFQIGRIKNEAFAYQTFMRQGRAS